MGINLLSFATRINAIRLTLSLTQTKCTVKHANIIVKK